MSYFIAIAASIGTYLLLSFVQPLHHVAFSALGATFSWLFVIWAGLSILIFRAIVFK